MRLNTLLKRWTTHIAIALSVFCAISTAEASCHVWNGCMWRVGKNLVEFRKVGQTYIEISQKCIDALNGAQSIVALR